MEEEQNNYFSSPLIFKIIIAPPPTPLPDMETYPILLSGRGVKFFKNGVNVDLFAPNFSNDFFWKLGASKSTLAPFFKKSRCSFSSISPLSNKRVLAPFYKIEEIRIEKKYKKMLF